MTAEKLPLGEVSRVNLRSYTHDPNYYARLVWMELIKLIDYNSVRPNFHGNLLIDYDNLKVEFARSDNWNVGFAVYWTTSHNGECTRMSCEDLTKRFPEDVVYRIEYQINPNGCSTERFLVVTRVFVPEDYGI